MGTIRRFEEIEAWQTARVLTQQVYVVEYHVETLERSNVRTC
jgi:hypothetical protein